LSSGAVTIRDATPDDVELIYGLIRELAEYERAPDSVTGTPEMLRRALFGSGGGAPFAEAAIAERDGGAVGFALFHGTFSTWECLPGIWLEDLYVPPQHRRGGVGEKLLRHVAALAVQRGCARLEWAALDWNTPALQFYERLGAEVLGEWKMHRISNDTLARLAS
jgi:GNAT superfamily N-acetyltransferase